MLSEPRVEASLARPREVTLQPSSSPSVSQEATPSANAHTQRLGLPPPPTDTLCHTLLSVRHPSITSHSFAMSEKPTLAPPPPPSPTSTVPIDEKANPAAKPKSTPWYRKKSTAPAGADPKAGVVGGGEAEVAIDVVSGEDEKGPATKPIAFRQLFRYTTRGEMILNFLGLIAACEYSSDPADSVRARLDREGERAEGGARPAGRRELVLQRRTPGLGTAHDRLELTLFTLAWLCICLGRHSRRW